MSDINSDIEARKAGRRCCTCYWFWRDPDTDQRSDGFCGYRPPPVIDSWGKLNRRVQVHDWCSAWMPDMEKA